MAAAFTSASLFAAAVPASAGVVLSSVLGGLPTGGPGTILENFNGCSGAGNCITSSGIVVSFTPDGTSTAGSTSGINAAPYMVGNNSAFDGVATFGPDTTSYLTTGVGGFRLDLPTTANYFGIYLGSVDGYNNIDFYRGNTLITHFTGYDVSALANGDQGALGSFYLNFNADVLFDNIRTSSSQYAGEFDNAAFNEVPEPSTLAMFATILAGLGFLVSRRKRNDFASGMMAAI
jgi:hypothetical protein